MLAVDTSNLLKNASSHNIVEYSQLFDQLIKDRLLSKIKAVEKIHKLVEQGKITLIEDGSAVVKFRVVGTYSIEDEFQERKARIQQAYTKGPGLAEVQTVLLEEARSLREHDKYMAPAPPENEKQRKRRFAR